MEFTCSETPNGITVHIGPHQGSYVPWWKNLQVEVYGSNSSSKASVTGSTERVQSSFDALRHVITVLVPDNGTGRDVQVESNQ
jgi:alpha-glucosidase